MTAYDFHNLSPLEFEDITHDLLQRAFDLPLEAFAPGRDGGIDLRYCSDTGRTLVVQCKHYIDSGYSALKAALLRELPKLRVLAPKRYVIATSVQLTLKNKREIKSLLSPFIRRTSDVYGLRDLNALLRNFPDVERTHFKLWLNSTVVLQAIVHSAAFNQTEWDKERIHSRARLYVQNKSFSVAKELLDKHGFCIIAGNPGIGKTTLADMLVLDHLGHGFEAHKVEHHISEMKEVAVEGARQVFYYDDFLGQTSFEDKLDKNEDKSLVAIIDKIRRSRQKSLRLILTTREYILNSAKMHYGPLAAEDWHPFECIVTIQDYSRSDRARVLYNHLFFSRLPVEYKKAILSDRRLIALIDHKHYNPRIIDWMTDDTKVGDCDPAKYVDLFLSRMESPYLIWQDALEHKIRSGSRHLLLVLASLPHSVRERDLEMAWERFYLWRGKKYGFSCDPREFRHALRELDGNFISISKGRGSDRNTRFVQFHNPSVRDCVESYLKRNLREATELCRTASFFEQLGGMWNAVWKHMSSAPPKIFWKSLDRTLDARSCTYTHYENITLLVRSSIESRASFVLDIARQKPSDVALACAAHAVECLNAHADPASLSSATILLIATQLSAAAYEAGQLRLNGLRACKTVMLANASGAPTVSRQFGDVAEFIDHFPGALSDVEVDAIRERFRDVVDDDIESIVSNIEEHDIDEIQKAIDVTRRASEVLSFAVEDKIALLEAAHRARVAYDEEKSEPVESWETRTDGSQKSEDMSDAEIRGMFETLLVDE